MVTLWTPKEKIAPLLVLGKKVALVGQLYTKAGIEFIIRNLWANPRVSCLVVCGRDLSQSGQALVDFFQKGKISFPSGQIGQKELAVFQKKVRLVDLRQEKNWTKIAQAIGRFKPHPPFAQKPKLFPQPPPPPLFPSENSVFRVEALTIGEAWLQLLALILKFGRRVPRIYLYGGWERTLLNLAVVITREEIKNPKIWPFFNFSRDELKRYFRNFFTPRRGKQAYTYGERLFAYQAGGKVIDQVAEMVKKLKSFPFNKGAIATLWQPQVDNFPLRRPWRTPCLNLIQGFCLNDKFYLTAYFRANDMFGAWPFNAFALRKLQTEIAKRIDRKLGDLTTISQTAFIDKNDLAKAKKVVEKNILKNVLGQPWARLMIILRLMC